MTDSNSRELEVLAEIPRGKFDVLRCTLDEFAGDDGTPHRYISLRVWNGDGPDKKATRKGCTIRAKEIMEVGRALKAGLDAMADDGRFSRDTRQPTAPTKPEPAADWDGVF